MKKFTKADLKNAKGPDGNYTLIAVNGKVYDTSTSKMWKKGEHVKSHHAGQDLSLEIQAAPHGLEVLKDLKQIGIIEEQQAETKKQFQPPLIVKKLHQYHLHPMAVHFPIAFVLLAGVFLLAFIVFEEKHFDMFVLYCVIIASIGTIAAISTGLLSWKYNYHAVWTPIYRGKIFFSLLLVTMQVGILVFRLYIVEETNLNSTAYLLYTVLVLGMIPMIILLGYLGGKITFPS